MKTHNTDERLDVPLEELGFSEAFLKKCRKRKYQCLRDIVNIGLEGLIKDSRFDHAWFDELTTYLRKRFMLYVLDAKR